MSPKTAVGLAVLTAALTGATSASAAELLSERVTAAEAVPRSCLVERDGPGVERRVVTVPDAGWVSARLSAGGGDWDLGVFDAESGRRLTGSSYFGSDELAEGIAAAGQRVVVQACRRSGASRTANLEVGSQAVEPSREKSSLVQVFTPNRARKNDLAALGLDLTEHAGPGFVEVVLHGADDARRLREAKFSYEVEVRDLAAQSAKDRAADARYARSVRASALPSGRDKYRMLEDYNNEMKTLAEQNPSIVKPLTLPFKTGEGRTVQGIEITEDVAARDGKPVFLQMGVHHAREWPSGEHAMEWAYELVNGYKANNARVRNLMRASRTIVIPIVNPDGFNNSRLNGEAQGGGGGRGSPNPGQSNEIVNIVSHPGEYRRKNCRLGESSEQANCLAAPAAGLAAVGVDPNRNYGGFWGGDGAAANAESETFRGYGPFSEPETRNVRDVVSKRHVTTLITNHTFGNLLLRPPGLASLGAVPDENKGYKALGEAMAAENGYSNQFSYQLYDTTGTTEDWTYYATGGFGYTYEIGCVDKNEDTQECARGHFHPPFAEMVKEYDGTTTEADENGRDGQGNREAYFKAQENTADAGKHSVIAGGAPRSAILRLRKSFDTPTSRVLDTEGREGERRTFRDDLDTTTEVPASGRYEWHVNPSTRPLVAEERGRAPTGPPSDPITFSGSPATPPDGAAPGGDANTTNPLFYNDHAFTIPNDPGRDNAKATVRLDWETQASDWDMKVFVDSNGDGSSAGETTVVGASEQGATSFEQVRISSPAPGAKYVARVVNFAAAEPYDGDVSFQGPDYFPKAVESWRLSCETQSGSVLSSQDVFIARGERKTPDLAACTAALNRAFATGRGCDRPTGRSRGTALDRARLGRSRLRHLQSFRIGIRGRGPIDRFCFTDRRQLRIGYPSRRLRRGFGNSRTGRSFRRRFTSSKAVLILTSSKRFRIARVRVGSSTRTLRRSIGRRARGIRVGRNVWYTKRGSKARIVYKVRGRKVYEVGIADRTLTATRARQAKFFKSFR